MTYARLHIEDDFKDSGTYESVVEFSKRHDHGGLYLIKVDRDDPEEYHRYLGLLTFKLTIKNENFLPEYMGVHISDIPFEALNNHSVVSDGAIAVNREGLIMDDHRLVRYLYPELICEEALRGAGHASMASVSLHPDVSAYVCSHEKQTVMKFRNGKITKMWTGDKTVRPSSK